MGNKTFHVMKQHTITPQNALMRLETLCARSEQCTYDIQQKLYKWGISSTDSCKIIKNLINRKFIDDNRFAEAFVRDKFRFSKWGRLKISQALSLKQIPRHIINDALELIDPDDYEATLIYTIMQKAKNIDMPDSFEGKTRLFRFVASRGFEPSLIIKIINSRKWAVQE